MAAKFEIVQPNPGEFRWVLMSQGRVLARSDAYTRKISCVNAMESFRKAAPGAAIVDHTARPATGPASVPAKAARATGRVVGKAAAKVAEVPAVAISAVEKVVEAITPAPPRKRAARAR